MPTLYLSLELGTTWKLAFTPGLGQRPRVRGIAARALDRLDHEIASAKRRFALPAAARVVSCYEAGRDGFWLHRALVARGIENRVVDSSSIEVNRRARRVKDDGPDAEKLVLMLVRFAEGDRRVWKVVTVPTEADEDRRTLNRELDALTRDRTAFVNRLHGLLATQGVRLELTGDVSAKLAAVRRWDGTPVPAELQARLGREWASVGHLTERIDGLKAERRRRLQAALDRAPAGERESASRESGEARADEYLRRLYALRGIGETGAWTYVREFFGWREFRNRRQVGGLAGLTPTSYSSGASRRELGVSKAGNRYIRYLAVELAWIWVRYQPQSALSRWYQARFGHGSSRLRRIGIVALARKLLIALWRYLETGVVPEGAMLKV
jgi:transposase